MVNITAKDVQKLRQMTGAPMMDCKAALIAAKGDMEIAKEILRKKGQQLVDKKADRETNQGLVGVDINKFEDGCLEGRLAQVFCETDFVARNEDFQNFVRSCVTATTSQEIDTSEIVSKVGENVKVGKTPRITIINDDETTFSIMGAYVHNRVAEDLGTIGVIVVLDASINISDEEANKLTILARQIAMHVAAMKPKAVSSDDLDEEFIENERRIFTEQAKETGKPDNIIEKMVEGRLQKSLKEVCLNDQAFVVDPNKTVGEVLKEHNAECLEFIRLAIEE